MLSAYMALYLAIPSSAVIPSTGMGGKTKGADEEIAGAAAPSEGGDELSAKDAMTCLWLFQ
jgi:hypothetical protein